MAPGKSDKDKNREPVVSARPQEQPRPAWGTFPGPRGADVPLRVAMAKAPYAQVTGHAQESLDAEICGVLVGQACEDDEGPFLTVTAAIRGNAARKGTTHVTFTQETWTQIHRTLETEHPKRSIVGWYHSHPGFGVEFSEMDLFIQKNFFSPNRQVAMVIDPLGGQVGLCVDTAAGVKYIDRFWIDGREHRCQTPKRGGEGPAGAGGAAGGGRELVAAMEALQARVTQALQAMDQQRAWVYRMMLSCAMVIAAAAVAWILVGIYRSYTAPLTAPQLMQPWSVSMVIDGKVVKLTGMVVGWEVPPELNAIEVQLEKERRAAAEKAEAERRAQEPKPAATQPASTKAVESASQPAVPGTRPAN